MADEPKTLTSLADLGEVALPDADIEPEPQIDRLGRTYATGKRKDAVARVWLRPGIGTITVNKRPVETYFARPALRMIINQPADLVGRRTQYDVICTVKGGGLSGQAGALRHGISPRARGTRAGAAQDAQVRRLPHPRQPRRGAQEVRQAQGPPQLPVLEALGQASPARLLLRLSRSK